MLKISRFQRIYNPKSAAYYSCLGAIVAILAISTISCNCNIAFAILPGGERPPPPRNYPPTADSQSVTTTQNTPINIIMTGDDPNNDPITFSVVDNPLHGTLALGASTDFIEYTPSSGYIGSDSFTYIAKDNHGATSDKATVSITINAPPPPPPPRVASTDPTTLKGSVDIDTKINNLLRSNTHITLNQATAAALKAVGGPDSFAISNVQTQQNGYFVYRVSVVNASNYVHNAFVDAGNGTVLVDQTLKRGPNATSTTTIPSSLYNITKITSSVDISSKTFDLIRSLKLATLDTATSAAIADVGSGSRAVSSIQTQINGYLVYVIDVLEAWTFNHHIVFVDAGNGKVLLDQVIQRPGRATSTSGV